MHTCKADNCTSNVFGGGYCKYHQYLRRMRGGDLFKPKLKEKSSIKPLSDKRKVQRKYYAVETKERFDEAVTNGTNICIFCDKKVIIYEGWHHLKGRENDKLLDWDYIKLAHNQCHVWDYHQASYEQRKKQPWWQGFLLRLKAIDESLYRAELRKGEKAHKLNPDPTLFDEELF